MQLEVIYVLYIPNFTEFNLEISNLEIAVMFKYIDANLTTISRGGVKSNSKTFWNSGRLQLASWFQLKVHSKLNVGLIMYFSVHLQYLEWFSILRHVTCPHEENMRYLRYVKYVWSHYYYSNLKASSVATNSIKYKCIYVLLLPLPCHKPDYKLSKQNCVCAI